MKNENNVLYVTKASGELEPFSVEKVRASLQRAGIPKLVQDKALAYIQGLIYPNIKTSLIYHHIMEFLGMSGSPHLKGKYSLKQAIMDLGPTGFPFEQYVARLLEAKGYAVETNIIVKGKCVTHEIDAIAQKEEKHFLVECKFHGEPGSRCNVKIPLYIKARFDDVESSWKEYPGHEQKFHQAWLVTNTKCTTDAIAYGECVGMKIVSWDYPMKGSFSDLIETTGLHPITCLTSLSHKQKVILLDQHIVLCREILENQSILNRLGLSQSNKELLSQEIEGMVAR